MSDIWNHEADALDSLIGEWYEDAEGLPDYMPSRSRAKHQPCCKYCKSVDVEWTKLPNGSYRLINKGVRPAVFHTCQQYIDANSKTTG